MNQEIFGCFCQDQQKKQAGHDLNWLSIDLLLIDSKNLAELILRIFFRVFGEI